MDRKHQEDNKLVEAAKRGDKKAFEALYYRYRDYVLIVAGRFGVSGDAALDVLQETFFYFFKKLPDFELRARFSTFLYPVVKNTALKAKAGGARLVSFKNGGLDIAQIRAPETVEEWGRAVIETVNALSKEHREVLLLRFVDGMSLGEIALTLDIPLGTVKSRLHHGLSSLRKLKT